MIDRNKTLDLMREAKFNSEDHYAIVEMLLHFAALIAAHEREACAKVCYELPWKDADCIPSNLAFAAAIRARGQA